MAILAAVTHHEAVAHKFGETACIFATEPSCINAYGDIFLGGDSLT